MKKMKVLALVLAAIMVLALLPAISFADDPASSDGYYLIGIIQGVDHWTDNFNNTNYEFRKFTTNPDNNAEMMLRIDLNSGDSIKVARIENGLQTEVLPGNGCAPWGINTSGNYTIYFRADGQGGVGWSYGYDYVSGPNNPFVAGHSLTLSGEIGVNFYVNMSNWTDTDTTMYFTIYDKNDNVLIEKNYHRYDGNVTNINGVVCYGYTCFINVIQMAQRIHAVLKNSSNYTILEEDYSAEEYFKTVNDKGLLAAGNNTFDVKTKNLIIATWHYGIELQKFLVSVNHLNKFTMMEDTVEIPAYMGTLKQTVAEYIPAYGITKDAAWLSTFDTTQFQLVLDYKTTIKVYMTPKSGAEITSLTLNDVAVDHPNVGGELVVTISDIPAHELITTRTLKVNNNGTAVFSGLSYARSMLNYSNEEVWTNAANALAAYAVYAAAYNAPGTYYND